MQIRHKDEKKTGVAEYSGMSLRHEHVANENLPAIKIFFVPGALKMAEQISFGVEEEGLPRCGIESAEPFSDALQEVHKKGLGVSIAVDMQKAQVFCRQFKKSEAFMHYDLSEQGKAGKSCSAEERLRIAGKNASRIVKHKPFILDGEA